MGHRGDINRYWYLVTSGRRTPEGEGERSQIIGWDPKTEVGLSPHPSAEIDSKKVSFLSRARGRQTHSHLLRVEDKRISETRGTPGSSSQCKKIE